MQIISKKRGRFKISSSTVSSFVHILLLSKSPTEGHRANADLKNYRYSIIAAKSEIFNLLFRS